MGTVFRSQSHAPASNTQSRFVSLESFNHDGIEIVRRRSRRRALPLRQLCYFLLVVLSFKIFLFLNMGAAAYGAKIEEMSQGAGFERLAARAMVLDPVSQWFVDGVRFGRWI